MYDKTTDKHRKEIELDQKFDSNGSLTSHKEKKIEIIKVSALSEMIQMITLVVVGIIGVTFMFMVAIGGIKLINNMTNNVEVQQ